ncbi:MAG: PLP-dependent aminotransferase family protein [Rhodospirillaceae bacterium]|nr:PLP-dependent aminotransferase family protein [Rhodospirillales bacterium]
MSNWLPDLAAHSGPKYRAIVGAIATDLRAGRLPPGTRMPTHRDLAWRLKVTVGTVARAYAEAERQGLLSGEVGRGTFVKDPGKPEPGLAQYLSVAWAPRQDVINMAVNRPDGDQGAWAVGPVLERLARRADLPQLLSYNLEPVAARQREAGARWLRWEQAVVSPERVAVTAGSQQAIVAALATLTLPGDSVAVEEYTYPGIKSAASLLSRPLVPVACDQYGLIPDEVERLFSRGVKVLYTIATVQNPRTSTLDEQRRAAIARSARKYGAYVIEDGVHRFLNPNAPPPIQVHAPDNCIYLTTLSKSVSPGLRTSFAAVPEALKSRFDAAIGALSLAQPIPLIEAACILIDEGQAFEAADRQRKEAAARIALAVETLGERVRPGSTAYNIWLPLDGTWRSSSFIAEAARQGVSLAPTESFAVGRPSHDGVRVSVTAPPDRATLVRGLKTLAGLLAVAPDQLGVTV